MNAPTNPSIITSSNEYLFGPFAKHTAQLDLRRVAIELFPDAVVIDGGGGWPTEQPVVAIVGSMAKETQFADWFQNCPHLIRAVWHPAGQFGPVSFSALAVGDIDDRLGPDDQMLAFASSSDLHRFVGSLRKRGVTVLARPPRAGNEGTSDEAVVTAAVEPAVASGPLGMLKRLVRWYLAPSGLLLAGALVLLGYGFLGLWFSRIVGLVGLVVLGLFLPYRFERQERKAIRLVDQNRHRIARLENRRR